MTGVFFRPKFWKCEFLLPQNFRKFRNRQIPDEETKLWHLFDEDMRKWNCLAQIFSKFWRPKPSNLHWAALGSCFRHIRGIEEHTCYIDNIFHHSDFQGILFAVASRTSIFICGLKFHIRNLWSMSCQIIRLFLFALDVMHTFQVDLDCRNDLHCWAKLSAWHPGRLAILGGDLSKLQLLFFPKKLHISYNIINNIEF